MTDFKPGLGAAFRTSIFGIFRVVRSALMKVALAALVMISPPAFAQIFSDDIARETAAKNAENLDNLARVVQNLRTQLGSVSQKQQDIEQRLRELSGAIEEARTRLADKRTLQNLETTVSRAADERDRIAAEVAELSENFSEIHQFISLPEEQELYETAFADFQNNDYPKAVSGFRRVLKFYPDGQFNANARHWMSQSFLNSKQYAEAADMARQILSLHAGSDKAPDAMLTLARAQQNLAQKEESRATLEALISAHPTTLAADRARQMLSP